MEGNEGAEAEGGREDATGSRGEVTENNDVRVVVRAEENCRESAPEREWNEMSLDVSLYPMKA